MESWLTAGTSLLLILGWVLLEVAQARRCTRGTVLQAIQGPTPLADGLARDLVVRLDDGREVRARASGCVRCQGDLREGRRVALLRGREGYVVVLPWSGCGTSNPRHRVGV